MKTVRVNLGARSYDIRIGRSGPAEPLHVFPKTAKVLIVTDTNVDALYGEACEQAWRAAGAAAARAVLPAGETAKTLANLEVLYERAAEHGLDRASLVVALGGGVVGDVAGFMAATYMRGIGFWQIPTTLLAMVDSSVGGKTGVNLKQGKNLVGAFHQPLGVVADVSALTTLPERDYVSGLAEVAKYGVIRDADLLETLAAGADRLKARDPVFLEDAIARCCEIKADVVANDERESGLRELLNFGHTMGHALEQADGYTRWRHGEAVAMGMVYAARLSAAETGLPEKDVRRLEELLALLGLPTAPGPEVHGVDWETLRVAMGSDKKSRGQKPRFVLAERLGQARVGCDVSESVMRRVYGEWMGS